MIDISNFIDKIIGVNTEEELKTIDLYNKRMFVYTYSCIDQADWNKEEHFENLENEFLKFSNVLSNNSTFSFNADELEKVIHINKQFKYARFGLTKQSASLMCSSVDINNYTKILFDYENEYLYTLIINLYQRIYLKKLENEFENDKNIQKFRKCFCEYEEKINFREITNSLTGTIFFNKWKEIFEINKIYSGLKNKYDIIYKELDIQKNTKVNKFILIALFISLLLNVINFIVLTRIR